MSQNDPKTTSLMMSPTKKFAIPNQRFFSSARFEQLSSAIGGGAMALVRQLKNAGFRPKSRYNTFVDRLSKYLNWYTGCL